MQSKYGLSGDLMWHVARVHCQQRGWYGDDSKSTRRRLSSPGDKPGLEEHEKAVAAMESWLDQGVLKALDGEARYRRVDVYLNPAGCQRHKCEEILGLASFSNSATRELEREPMISS